MTKQHLPLEHSNLLLLDTNVLSPEKLAENGSWSSSTLVTASTSARRSSGCSDQSGEGRYRYALLRLERFKFLVMGPVTVVLLVRASTAERRGRHMPSRSPAHAA